MMTLSMQYFFHNLAPIEAEQQRLPHVLILEERQGGIALIQEDHRVAGHRAGIQIQRRRVAHLCQLIGRYFVEALNFSSPISGQHRRKIRIEFEVDLRNIGLAAIIAGKCRKQHMLRLAGFTTAELFHLKRPTADRFAVERQSR